MEKTLFGLIAYIPWFAWMIGFSIYKGIRRENIWESKVFVPGVWILAILGWILNPILLALY